MDKTPNREETRDIKPRNDDDKEKREEETGRVDSQTNQKRQETQDNVIPNMEPNGSEPPETLWKLFGIPRMFALALFKFKNVVSRDK